MAPPSSLRAHPPPRHGAPPPPPPPPPVVVGTRPASVTPADCSLAPCPGRACLAISPAGTCWVPSQQQQQQQPPIQYTPHSIYPSFNIPPHSIYPPFNIPLIQYTLHSIYPPFNIPLIQYTPHSIYPPFKKPLIQYTPHSVYPPHSIPPPLPPPCQPTPFTFNPLTETRRWAAFWKSTMSRSPIPRCCLSRRVVEPKGCKLVDSSSPLPLVHTAIALCKQGSCGTFAGRHS